MMFHVCHPKVTDTNKKENEQRQRRSVINFKRESESQIHIEKLINLMFFETGKLRVEDSHVENNTLTVQSKLGQGERR